MKRLFALTVVCFITFSLHAQTAKPVKNTGNQSTKNLSKIETPGSVPVKEVLVLKETEYDFGKIPQGRPVTHVFDVENNGTDSIKIMNVQASCGCTTPDWERNKVQAPNEKTKITVGYNAASEGPFTKTITISYNGNQTKQIIIKGEVWKTPATSAPDNKGIADLKDL
jgi:hypothetical protein